jgi:predicted nucleic acid-binding protein
MSRIYLDSSPVIYLVQQVAPYWAALQTRLAVSGVVCVSSELTRMECLVRPIRNGDTSLIQDFDPFFGVQVTELVAFTAAVFRRAADIRAQFGFKTPDALHLAAALESACDVLLTNDAQLTRCPQITVEVV